MLENMGAEVKQQGYIDMIAELEKQAVRYLIVGGYAVCYYSQPRVTKDIDIWIETGDENAEPVYAAVAGMEPVGVNVLTTIPGLAFERAWEHRVAAGIEGTELSAYYISRDDLIATKLVSGLLRDLADVSEIREASELSRTEAV